MIICVCKQVNSTQVREAMARGITEVEQLSEYLGLGTGCGRCVDYARQMVERETGMIATTSAA